VAHSLEGTWREDVLFELQQAVNSYQFAQQQMLECDQQLEQYLATLPTRSVAGKPEPQPAGRRKRAAKPRGNAPALDLQTILHRIAGVDLTTIDGIHVMTALTILSEVGPDLSAFPSEGNFASWLGLTPNKAITGRKVIRSETREVQNRVAAALRMGASTLRESRSYLGGRYRHLQRSLPSKASAVKAMAHYLALLVYRLLTKGQAWVDIGAAQFEEQRRYRETASLVSRAKAQGLMLVPISAQLPT
jgi:transposase